MLKRLDYQEAWERKLGWYQRHGFARQLITSQDGPDGSIDSAEIERIARERILNAEG